MAETNVTTYFGTGHRKEAVARVRVLRSEVMAAWWEVEQARENQGARLQ